MYCLIKEGKVTKYPYDILQLQEDNPAVSFTVNENGLTLTEEQQQEWGIYPVLPTFPDCDPITHSYRETLPELRDGKYFQAWVISENSPELVEDNRLRVADFIGFYDTLIASDVYQRIRSQALTNLPLLLACTEFIAAFTDAKAGRPNRVAIQTCILNVVGQSALDGADKQLLSGLLVQHRMDLLFTLE